MKIMAFIIMFSASILAQTNYIILDEEFDDWINVTTSIEDADDNLIQGVDFKKLWITNDAKYLFIRIDFYDDIIIQEDTSTILLVDTDNNKLTGSQIYNSGAEIKYMFGKRQGYYYYNNDSISINQNDIKIISAPTVSSSSYEMKIDLNNTINGQELFKGNEISIKFINIVSNIDVIPNDNNNLDYHIKNGTENYTHDFSLNKINDDAFRLLSYNVHRDDIFDNVLKPKFTRLIKAINPEIITFQEIYDHSSSEVATLIEEILPSEGEQTWYHAKIDPINNNFNNRTDLIIISRYPILESFRIQGVIYSANGVDQSNSAHLIDLPDTETNLLVVNAHPPCCSNYYFRGIELQEIMTFIKDVKTEGGNITLDNNTPIIITGDMNLVGPHEERDILVYGDLLDNNSYGENFNPDWDNTPFSDAKPNVTGFPGVFTWYDESSSFSPGRLDYIIYSDYTLDLVNSYSLFTKTIDKSILSSFNLDSLDAINASDHLPLVADFLLKNIVSEVDAVQDIPEKIILNQNYPNPFNPSTIISFSLPDRDFITLNVYDVLGRKVKTLVADQLNPGNYRLEFNASDLESGIYFYRLYGKKFTVTKKLIFMK